MINPARMRSTLLSLLLSIPVGAIAASAQQAATPAPQAKTFDVVSIRQNLSQTGQMSLKLVPTPTGFQVNGMPLMIVLMTAYTPKAGGLFLNNIDNLPDWARPDRYDIDARISDDDRAAWTAPKNQPAMLQQMLATMLADRFKLVVHRTNTETPVYELVVGKDGPKLTETTPDEPLPAGQVLPDGAVVVPGKDGPRFYNFSMGLLASALSENGNPVVDKTGLTGRYNIVLPRPAADYAADGDPEAQRLDLIKSLGLKLESAKQQVEFLVIDHIDKPTEN